MDVFFLNQIDLIQSNCSLRATNTFPPLSPSLGQTSLNLPHIHTASYSSFTLSDCTLNPHSQTNSLLLGYKSYLSNLKLVGKFEISRCLQKSHTSIQRIDSFLFFFFFIIIMHKTKHETS